MILTRLVLKDFGGHANLEIASTARTQGILGPNGAGKSTILSAINFLLTGETADAQETYVRAGQDNGSGDLTFQKNGMTGRIFRQIGKTPKRRLEWDGRVITKAAEVDDTLGALFGADKKAVSSAVFIAQGDLQNILFGGEADRETLFIRLVNLAFCDQRAKMLDGKIKKISLTVQDLGAVIDQARLETQRTQLSADEANAQLALLPDFRTEITRLDEHLNLVQQITEAGRSRQEATTRRSASEERLSQFLRTNELSDGSALATKVMAIGLALGSATKRAEDIRTTLENLRLLQTKEEEVTRQHAAFAKLSQEVVEAGITGQLDDDTTMTRLDREIRGHQDLERSTASFKTARQQLEIAETALAALVNPKLGDQILALTESANSKRTILDHTNRLIKLQEELTKCLGKIDPTNSRCRECGLKIDANQEVDAARLQECQVAAITLQEELVKVNAELRQLGKQQADFDGNFALSTRNCQIYREQYADYKKRLEDHQIFAGVDVQANTKLATEIRTRKSTLERLLKEQWSLKEVLQRLQDGLAPFAATRALVGNPDYTQPKLIEAISQRDALTKEQTRLSGLKTELATLTASLQEVTEEVERLSTREEQLMTKLGAIPSTEAMDQVLATFNGQVDLAKKELVNRQTARDTQLGVVKQAEQGRAEAVAKLKELQGRVAQDQKKLDCIARLQEMKALLSRSGLPGRYVAHRFQQLAGLTQQHLGKLNANFLITADAERPLSFRFCRTDNGVDLPMGKMSGGQRVRLCLAFLMAVQTALVPDVGLLVLDEPSMHLDAEGKESLAELLRDAGQRLGGGESQIWVVDHAMELAPALGSVLNLG